MTPTSVQRPWGEFQLIRHFAALSGKPSGRLVLGIGDDCAAIRRPGRGRLLLLTCDPVIEGIHFDRSATPFEIGWKAMARNLSDIAAMGGIPLYALAAASLPKNITQKKAMGIHKGMTSAARRCGVRIIGGDTSRNPGGIHLTITLIGEVKSCEMITRSGARVGDAVCVTGALGASLRGKHLRFLPRISEARFLAARHKPTSMMDLSDGLAGDLRRLAEQSRVGFEIWTDCLPISSELRRQQLPRKAEITHALADGEDYELLFTLPPQEFPRLVRSWTRRFKIPLTRIGAVLPSAMGLRLKASPACNRFALLKIRAYDHFFATFRK
ncbi:MAG: thiamine-phosphate kinase [Verrucomicrobiae bacterium]|nr:thiamine-phosphate kinase [Verrucomicrobiae bacterium]